MSEQMTMLHQFMHASDDRRERAQSVLTIIRPHVTDEAAETLWPALVRCMDAYTYGAVERISDAFDVARKPSEESL